VLKNVKESTTANSKFCCKVQKADRIFCCFITPTNNNFAETGQFLMLY